MRFLMVCLGNICRSPLAEGIMQHKIHRYGLDWIVDSAGTSGYHIGSAPDKRSIEIAQKNNIDISRYRARRFNDGDFDNYDYILVMDSMNYSDIIHQAINKEEKDKVQLIMNYVHPEKNLGVPDPYYGGTDGFEQVYRMLDEACEKIIDQYK